MHDNRFSTQHLEFDASDLRCDLDCVPGLAGLFGAPFDVTVVVSFGGSLKNPSGSARRRELPPPPMAAAPCYIRLETIAPVCEDYTIVGVLIHGLPHGHDHRKHARHHQSHNSTHCRLRSRKCGRRSTQGLRSGPRKHDRRSDRRRRRWTDPPAPDPSLGGPRRQLHR